MTTQNRPAFRKPWTHGARAYFEADTFDALREGMKRMRTSKLVHMSNDGEAGDALCASCGIALREPVTDAVGNRKADRYSVWTWIPARKAAYGQHYLCSWDSLMRDLFTLADRGLLH